MVYRKHIFICINNECAPEQLARELVKKFNLEIKTRNLNDVTISETLCLGICKDGPLLVIYPDNRWFFNVKPENVPEIVEKYVV